MARREPTIIDRLRNGEISPAQARAEAKARPKPRTMAEGAAAGEIDPTRARAARDAKLARSVAVRKAKEAERAAFSERERAKLPVEPARRKAPEPPKRVAAPRPTNALEVEPDDIAGKRMREFSQFLGRTRNAQLRK